MYPLSVPRGRVRCEHDPHIACKPYKQLDVSINYPPGLWFQKRVNK
jgi:hypothetical protein